MINEFHKNSYDFAVWTIPGMCQGVWGSNWKRRSADSLDSSNDSNDTLESRYAPRNPRSCSGFRFAEVLLIGCTLDSGARILESGPRAANRWWRAIQHCSGGRWGILPGAPRIIDASLRDLLNSKVPWNSWNSYGMPSLFRVPQMSMKPFGNH